MTEKKQAEHSPEWSQVSAFRLVRHHLADQQEAATLATLCRDVCGIQAQVMTAAQMALWARRHDLTRAAIEVALWKRRTLVKTSCMRGTLHLLSAADFPVYIAALKPSRTQQMRRVMGKYGGVTPALAERVTRAVVETLQDGPLTRSELTERILSLGIVRGKAKKWFQLGWWGVARQAVMEGAVCYGPERGPEVTFVRVDQWLPEQKEVEEHEAKRSLLRRYLTAYAPARPQDFSRWTGMPMHEVRPVWASLENELVPVSVEGRKGWILRRDQKHLASAALGEPILRLLPSFDAYLLGHVEKDHLVGKRHLRRVYRQAGWISPVVVLDGRVIGTWSLARQAKGLILQVALFGNRPKTIHARLEEEAASLAAFLETPCQIRYAARG